MSSCQLLPLLPLLVHGKRAASVAPCQHRVQRRLRKTPRCALRPCVTPFFSLPLPTPAKNVPCSYLFSEERFSFFPSSSFAVLAWKAPGSCSRPRPAPEPQLLILASSAEGHKAFCELFLPGLSRPTLVIAPNHFSFCPPSRFPLCTHESSS